MSLNAGISFSATPGRMKQIEFFSGTMKFGAVEKLVAKPDDFMERLAPDEEESVNRTLSRARIKDQMIPYLTEADDAFFSALTLVVVPPTLEPANLGEHYDYDIESKNLWVDPCCYLIPADGLHRSECIKGSLVIDPTLAAMDIAVVLIPFDGNLNSVRQLFSDLNLNAKKPSATIGLSMDRRDPMIAIAKMTAAWVDLFAGRVNRVSNGLSKTSANVITLNALYQGSKDIVEALYADEDEDLGDKIASIKGNDAEIESVAAEVSEVWEKIVANFPVWKDVISGERSAGSVRDEYVFPHGLGWQALAKAAAKLIEADPTGYAKNLNRAISEIDWSRESVEWEGIAMTNGRVNNTSGGINSTAERIINAATPIAA